jgi:ankyrin repeat protein
MNFNHPTVRHALPGVYQSHNGRKASVLLGNNDLTALVCGLVVNQQRAASLEPIIMDKACNGEIVHHLELIITREDFGSPQFQEHGTVTVYVVNGSSHLFATRSLMQRFPEMNFSFSANVHLRTVSEFLQDAVRNGGTEVVRLLLELDPSRGVDPSVGNNYQIGEAAKRGHTEIVRLLLELDPSRGVDPSVGNNSPLCEAAKKGHTEIVRLLLELDPSRGVDPSVKDNYLIRQAACHGQTEIMGLLLNLDPSRGVDPSANENQALRLAAFNGHTEIVRLLLDLDPSSGVDPSVDDNYPLRHAVKHGHTEVVRLLLNLDPSRGVDPSANENHALGKAAERGHTEVVRLLLNLDPSRGVDPSAKNNKIIRLSTQGGHFEIVKILLDLDPSRGVDPSVKDNYPFRMAVHWLSCDPRFRQFSIFPADSKLGKFYQKKLASFIPKKTLVPLFLNLTPSRGMTLPNHLLDIVYTNDYILDISEELFMTCDWSYELTVERLHTILQHRFGSFKRWCELDNNIRRLSDDLKKIVSEYSHIRTRLYLKRKLPDILSTIIESACKRINTM